MDSDRDERIGAIVLAGNTKIKKQLRRRKRRGVFYRIFKPSMWKMKRQDFEASLASKINKDDYIVGENKSLLYLHPELISQKNLNFLKRTLYFAGKTGDRIYRNNKKDLLEYLSRKGETSISLVAKSVLDSNSLDPSDCVIIGPKLQISRELKRCGIEGFNVEEQGDSIGDNVLIGKEVLSDRGFTGSNLLIIGGDIPLLTGESIDRFIEKALSRGEDPDIRYGMGSRRDLREFIKNYNLGSLGEVGPNYPKKGMLNKFGIPLIDDIGIFRKKDRLDQFMMGNLFMARFERINGSFIDRFYKLRKMGSNPLTYPYLIRKFFRPLLRSVRGKLYLSEAERLFKDITHVEIKVVPVDPTMTLDLDSYSDLRRLSMVRYQLQKTDHDLELELKQYLKGKKKKARKKLKGVG